jgi:hypothetical protein
VCPEGLNRSRASFHADLSAPCAWTACKGCMQTWVRALYQRCAHGLRRRRQPSIGCRMPLQVDYWMRAASCDIGGCVIMHCGKKSKARARARLECIPSGAHLPPSAASQSMCVSSWRGSSRRTLPWGVILRQGGKRAEREARPAQTPAKKPCPGIATSCSGKCEKMKKDKGRTPDAPRRAARRRPRPGATWRPARRRARPRARPPRRWRRCACRPWPAAWRRPGCSAPSAPRSRAAAGPRCTRRGRSAGAQDRVRLGLPSLCTR